VVYGPTVYYHQAFSWAERVKLGFRVVYFAVKVFALDPFGQVL